MRFVVLTYPSRRGEAILQGLAERQLRPDAVVLDAGSLALAKGAKRVHSTLRSQGPVPLVKKAWGRAKRLGLTRRQTAGVSATFAAYTDTVHTIDDAGSEEAGSLLESLAPDVIVLGSSRILPPAVIAIPPLGILNSHPGLLPEYRGIDTIAWAVLNGDPVGVSVHFIDVGIDTGPIVRRQPFDIQSGDSLADQRSRAAHLAGQLMADVVAELKETGTVERIPQTEKGTLYRRMSSRQLDQARARLRETVER